MLGEAFGLPQQACPDCRPDTRLDDLGSGVFVLRVFHDDTCPTFLRMGAARNGGR